MARAAGEKVTVGMAWPGMQDAVWSTSHKLLNEFADASDTDIELIFTAADMDVAKQSSDAKRSDQPRGRRATRLPDRLKSDLVKRQACARRRHSDDGVFCARSTPTPSTKQTSSLASDAKYQQLSSATTVFEKNEG